MGIPVLILGASGSGKSSSLRNLPDNIYSLIEVNGKPLPFRSKKRFVKTDDPEQIKKLIGSARSDLIVIDDSQYIMANAFMRQALVKGFEKFTQIGKSFWELINAASATADNKTVYFLHHTETDESGVKAKTIGRMIDEKIVLEGMFTIVLRAMIVDGQHVFTTQSGGDDTAKSPIGMFADFAIDNDLALVDAAIRSYYELPDPAVIGG